MGQAVFGAKRFNESIESLLEGAEDSIRMPQVAREILSLSESEDSQFEDLARVIQADVSFSARLLRLANSPLYRQSEPIDSIQAAVARVGVGPVNRLALTAAMADGFADVETELLRASSFWNHSLTCALLAEQKARRLRLPTQGLFAAGLLHDIGLLMQFALCADAMHQVLANSLASADINLVAAEQQILGFDHMELGTALSARWKLPPLIQEVVRYHHDPRDASVDPAAVAVVYWANELETVGTELTEDEASRFERRLHRRLPEHIELLRTELGYDVELLRSVQKEADTLLAEIL